MTFDATKHLRNIKGKGGNAEYLDVKWRLVWLRSEHPDATTAIEHIEISPDIAIFRATVTIPGGGSATDYGSETPKDFGDFIEKAATKALGRALAQLGYGTQFVGEELDEGERIVDSPVERPQDADLAIIRNRRANADERKLALHRYYSATRTLAELNERSDLAYDSGMDAEVLKAAYRHHHKRLAEELAPAGVAG